MIKEARNIITDAYVAATLNRENLPYEAGVLDEAGKLEARQWTANVYKQHGMVADEELAHDGTLEPDVDPFVDRSIYYGVRSREDSKLLMASRLIMPRDGDIYSMQMHTEDLPLEKQEELLPLGDSVAEFASYIKRPGLGPVDSRFSSLFLIREILRDSVDNDIDHWVFTMNPSVASSYERVFGNSMEKIGSDVRSGQFKVGNLAAFHVRVREGLQNLRTGSFKTLAALALKKFMTIESTSPEPGARVSQLGFIPISVALGQMRKPKIFPA